MKYISVCSGIEAATVAWESLGFQALAFSEIEAFPRAVLQYHYPNVPLHGDFTTIKGDEYGAADILVGGTPCQSFSIAGLRGGLADDRGGLALEYLRLAARTGAQWLIWENVPGVLSSNGRRDFGSFLGALGELGYGWAYRILDAQYFGVAQRRRRVFVVGYLGDWRRAAAILFERESCSWDAASQPEATEVFGTFARESRTRNDNFAVESGFLIQRPPGLAWITPLEVERAFGFPDGHTAIPYRNRPADSCPDGPRYKALGNSMAVPVIRWLGERIQSVEKNTSPRPDHRKRTGSRA
jgi:DNA (cytosine-5)-methyltransferase 1